MNPIRVHQGLFTSKAQVESPACPRLSAADDKAHFSSTVVTDACVCVEGMEAPYTHRSTRLGGGVWDSTPVASVRGILLSEFGRTEKRTRRFSGKDETGAELSRAIATGIFLVQAQRCFSTMDRVWKAASSADLKKDEWESSQESPVDSQRVRSELWHSRVLFSDSVRAHLSRLTKVGVTSPDDATIPAVAECSRAALFPWAASEKLRGAKRISAGGGRCPSTGPACVGDGARTRCRLWETARPRQAHLQRPRLLFHHLHAHVSIFRPLKYEEFKPNCAFNVSNQITIKEAKVPHPLSAQITPLSMATAWTCSPPWRRCRNLASRALASTWP